MARVSQQFSLRRGQESLEFVDVDVRKDVPLFVDPGAIRLLQIPLARECASTIQSFFSCVLDLMKSGHHAEAQELLSTLGEPNETHLGMSKGRSSGHGMGGGLAEALWKSLSTSKAVETGVLSDLEETSLFVHGVDRDIISDIVTNIIRGQLAAFTAAMTAKYNIPTVTNCPVVTWDRLHGTWKEELFSLPVIDGLQLLLVPRMFVRRRRGVFAADRYYRHFVIPVLQQEHFNANSSLVRLLADGKTRRPPFKKTLMALNPDVKALNVARTQTDPALLARYRLDAAKNFSVVGHNDLARGTGETPPDFDALLDAVLRVDPGDSGATTYHRAVERLLTALFYPALDMPIIEEHMNEGRKRIDIDYTNIASGGFFHWLHDVHHVGCSFIPVECKNYSSKLTNKEYDQLAGRFTTQRGHLGILCYRGFAEPADVMKHCRDRAQGGQGYILALDDADLTAIVNERKELETGEDFQFVWTRFKQLVQ
jgi:hypothetical protein